MLHIEHVPVHYMTKFSPIYLKTGCRRPPQKLQYLEKCVPKLIEEILIP